jgi:hypothetical protein
MSNDVRGKSYYEVLDVLFKVSDGPGLHDVVRAETRFISAAGCFD